MKRYMCVGGGLSPGPNGQWVRHKDAEAEIERLKAIVAPLPTDANGDPIVLGDTYLADGKPYVVEMFWDGDLSVHGGDPRDVGNDLWTMESGTLVPMPEGGSDGVDL